MNRSIQPILKELRFIICPNSLGSAGARAFLNTNYSKLVKNESTQLLIRECGEVDATVIARYSKPIN